MNKSAKRITALALGALMVTPMLVSCTEKQNLDPNTRPLVLSTDALDGNFNPYFYTAAPDGNIVSMTQIGLMTADENGKPVCGEDQPTVALDYKTTMIAADGKTPTDRAKDAAYTDYEFIIKNGIKFSDGVALTIEDVLFNLYVYLDPQYMGSSTIYSTDIVGLQAYRYQNIDAETQGSSAFETLYQTEADNRLLALQMHCQDETNNPSTPDLEEDFAKAKQLFKEELESDWTNSQGQLEDYEENYSFTEDWQVFFYNAGLVKTITNSATKLPIRDAETNKYVTNLNSLDEDGDGVYEYNPTEPINELMARELTSEKISAYATANNCSEEIAKNEIAKKTAIDYIYNGKTASKKTFFEVLVYWMTRYNLWDEFYAQAKAAYKDLGDDIDTISGITTDTTTTDFNGKDLGAEHSTLKIRIYKVDPKAIWNFSFAVAPMHYYSNAEAIEKGNHGVLFNDYDFFNDVLKDSNKNGLPVGAGVYMASTEKGGEANRDTFKVNEWVYFKANPYFETVGKELHNANIKYLRYKIVNSNDLITALENGEIDYGQPSASADNVSRVNNIKSLFSITYETNGYGYVGVNPKHVPDINVRRAIMKAMDISSVIDTYYAGGLAEAIYRPMSTTSWAYPKGVKEHESIAFTTDKEDIKALVRDAGWTWSDSDEKFYKDGKPLKLRFTIAGDSTDHPAFTMFNQAANFLNDCGFDITVGKDVQALSKLASGELAVWAAAWTSTIDPDMYQVYHIDSTATSTNNWGYDVIKKDKEGTYATELGIITELSDLIDQGRETLDETARKGIYEQALNKVMELAVEFPTYQRCDLIALNKNVINLGTVNQDPTVNSGVIDRIWEVNYR